MRHAYTLLQKFQDDLFIMTNFHRYYVHYMSIFKGRCIEKHKNEVQTNLTKSRYCFIYEMDNDNISFRIILKNYLRDVFFILTVQFFRTSAARTNDSGRGV